MDTNLAQVYVAWSDATSPKLVSGKNTLRLPLTAFKIEDAFSDLFSLQQSAYIVRGGAVSQLTDTKYRIRQKVVVIHTLSNLADAVQWLVEHGASIQGEYGETILRHCVAHGDMNTVQYLVERGCDPSTYGLIKRACVMAGHVPMVKWLYEQGARLEEHHMRSSCIYAAASGHHEMLRTLWDIGAPCTIHTLWAAVYGLHLPIIQCILDIGDVDPHERLHDMGLMDVLFTPERISAVFVLPFTVVRERQSDTIRIRERVRAVFKELRHRRLCKGFEDYIDKDTSGAVSEYIEYIDAVERMARNNPVRILPGAVPRVHDNGPFKWM